MFGSKGSGFLDWGSDMVNRFSMLKLHCHWKFSDVWHLLHLIVKQIINGKETLMVHIFLVSGLVSCECIFLSKFVS